MEYKGIIKGSRSLDMVAASMIVDAISLAVMAYTPEQLGITIPVYMFIRIGFGVVQAYLRFQTTSPVGEPKE